MGALPGKESVDEVEDVWEEGGSSLRGLFFGWGSLLLVDASVSLLSACKGGGGVDKGRVVIRALLVSSSSRGTGMGRTGSTPLKTDNGGEWIPLGAEE